MLEFIRYRLEYKGNQKKDPYPVGAAEAGAIKEREGGEESAAEGNQRGEGKFPFAAGGVQDHAFLLVGQGPVPQMQVGALDKHQGHQQTAQQGNQTPPIVL